MSKRMRQEGLQPTDALGLTTMIHERSMLVRTGVRILHTTLGVVTGLACLGEGACGAEGQPSLLNNAPPQLPWEKASVAFGGYFSIFDSSFAFSPGQNKAVDLSAEDLLGLDSTLTVFRVDALYRPGPRRRHQIDFSYGSYRRSGEATFQAPIDIGGGIVIPATTVYSILNFDIIRSSYSYAFLQSDHVRGGGGLGGLCVAH